MKQTSLGSDEILVYSMVFKTIWEARVRLRWVRFPHDPANFSSSICTNPLITSSISSVSTVRKSYKICSSLIRTIIRLGKFLNFLAIYTLVKDLWLSYQTYVGNSFVCIVS